MRILATQGGDQVNYLWPPQSDNFHTVCKKHVFLGEKCRKNNTGLFEPFETVRALYLVRLSTHLTLDYVYAFALGLRSIYVHITFILRSIGFKLRSSCVRICTVIAFRSRPFGVDNSVRKWFFPVRARSAAFGRHYSVKTSVPECKLTYLR